MTEAQRITLTRAANRAIRHLGGPTQGARTLQDHTGKQCTRDMLIGWQANGVAATWVLDVSELTGIKPWQLRPDIINKAKLQPHFS